MSHMDAEQGFRCVLCGAEGPQKGSTKVDPMRDIHIFTCCSCGGFRVTHEAMEDVLPQLSAEDKGKLSAYVKWRAIRHMPEPLIVTSRRNVPDKRAHVVGVQDVLDWFPKTVAGRLDYVLLNLHAMSKFPGDAANLAGCANAVCLAENDRAMIFTLKQLREAGLIEEWRTPDEGMVLTVKGWNRVAEIERGAVRALSRRAFVAMWFDQSMQAAYDRGIKKAIDDCGFHPLRIDMEQFNDKICDQIIAEIRRRRFLVADCTGHRNGVYYEAGFARGLGLPVIWTCRKNEMEGAHFDTRQFNHVVWEQPEELCEKLILRITATIPSP